MSGLVETVLKALIYIAVVVLCVVLVVWFCGVLGLPIPAQAVKIIYVIAALIAILILWRIVRPQVNI